MNKNKENLIRRIIARFSGEMYSEEEIRAFYTIFNPDNEGSSITIYDYRDYFINGVFATIDEEGSIFDVGKFMVKNNLVGKSREEVAVLWKLANE